MTGMTNSAAEGEPRVPEIGESTEPLADGATALAAPDAWRDEVAARLAHYRTRRKPRAPRYPSLLLPFDNAERRGTSAPAFAADSNGTGSEGVFVSSAEELPSGNRDQEAGDLAETSVVSTRNSGEPRRGYSRDYEAEPSSNVIEFPRSAAIPVIYAAPLADPILDRPRIVEAPEVVPHPPALGGMLIEPAQKDEADGRGIEETLVGRASIARRLLATLVDGAIVGAGLGAFGAIFLRFNPMERPVLMMVASVVALAVAFWMAYQYLLVVFTGSTPGLRAARLKLVRFDGEVTNRATRRWRVLATLLSGFSAGLGYLWCFVDQDSLCWHDRITRTYFRTTTPSA
jgi:uncharacterized RDD family membrane protein YckC